jgi:hypothetical protein
VLGAVVLSIFTWLSVSLQNTYSVLETIPVTLTEMPEGSALRYPVPSAMTMRVRGSGWRIAEMVFSPDVKYTINLATAGRGTDLITRKNILEFVSLPTGVEVIDVTPDTVWLSLTAHREKRVPVNPRIMLDVKEGYGIVGGVRVEPESVTVGGSLELLATLSVWNTEFRRYEDSRLPIDETVPLERLPEYGITVPGQSVRLIADIQPFAEKTFDGIHVTVVGTPADRDIVMLPASVQVIARGSIDQLSPVDATDFTATIHYRTIEGDTTGAVAPRITGPSGLEVVKTEPASCQYVVQMRGDSR